ncbi:MAG: hypothetical protein RMJ05_11970 [Thermomicrobium sp.]|nr:hypothetical protein [Thermomicrobium sp.]MDW8007411.1 hypothetical protein [Thermomicrobium sp.]
MRTLIRYTILNQDGQPVIRAVRVVYPSTARVAPPPQETGQRHEVREHREHPVQAAAREHRSTSGS